MPQEEGTLYFIEPLSKFKNKKEKGELLYDLTYQVSKDSITLNFSCITRSLLSPIDSFAIDNNQDKIVSSCKKIFLEPQGKKWFHRYSTKILLSDLHKLYKNNEATPLVIIYSGDRQIIFKIKSRSWKKESHIILKILDLIEVNK